MDESNVSTHELLSEATEWLQYARWVACAARAHVLCLQADGAVSLART